MANFNKSFDSYFESIKNQGQKIGELNEAEGSITAIQEYKSNKSGKSSLKLSISVQGGEIHTYLGYSSEKSAEISLARLTKLCIASVGMEETKKIYEAAANDEDVEDESDLIVELGLKLNKKLKKNPVKIIVSRTKTEDGFWDVRWHLADEPKSEQAQKTQEPPIPVENKEDDTGDFLDSLK